MNYTFNQLLELIGTMKRDYEKEVGEERLKIHLEKAELKKKVEELEKMIEEMDADTVDSHIDCGVGEFHFIWPSGLIIEEVIKDFERIIRHKGIKYMRDRLQITVKAIEAQDKVILPIPD